MTSNEVKPQCKGNDHKVDSIGDQLNQKFKQTSLHFNQRIRARKVFKLIDRAASKDFKKLIQASKVRLNHVKSGMSLEKQLKHSSMTNNQIIDDVCSKQLYFANDLIKEKEKLKTNLNKQQHEEISTLFKTLRGEKKGGSRLNPKQSSARLSSLHHKDKEIRRALKRSSSQQGSSAADQQLINDIIDSERKKVNDSISKYLSKTKKLGKDSCENESSDQMIRNAFGNSKEVRNCLFLTGHLRLLHFNQSSTKRVFDVKVSKDVFNIKKMLNYTQARDPCLCTTQMEDSLPISMPMKSKTEKRALDLEELKLSLMNERSRNKKNDFSETINVIKSELILNQSLKSTFQKKTNSLEQYFSKDTLPSVEEYSKRLNKKKKKTVKNKSTDDNISQIEQLTSNERSNFASSMSSIFKSKLSFWLKEDRERSSNIKSTISKERKMDDVVAKMENLKRFPSKFTDAYSLREGKSNKCNEDIAELLGNHLYTKEEMTNQILQYYHKFKEEETQKEKEKTKLWKAEKALNEEIRQSQRMRCRFSLKDSHNKTTDDYINKERLSKLFLTYRPEQEMTNTHEEDHFKEYLDFKTYCKRKEKK